MKWLIIFLSVVTTITVLMSGCGSDTSQNTENILSSDLGGSATLPENPLGPRTNPLQTYIRNNWTGGDLTDTGGLHYNHIKVLGGNWDQINQYPDAETNAEFVVDHFDAYMWGGPIIGEHADGQYSDFLWINGGANIPCIGSVWDSLETLAWLADSTLNTCGYTWDDIVMHFKYDCSPSYGSYPGWNPDDDLDGDGCRDDQYPSDSTRTAQCIGESEIFFYEDFSASPYWNRAKLAHPGYHKMTSDRILAHIDDFDYDFGGYFWDSCAMNVGWNWGLEKSFLYESSDRITSNLDYYLDKILLVPTLAADYLEPVEPALNIHFVNMVSPLYTCVTSYDSKDWAYDYLENFILENWMMCNDPLPTNIPMTTNMIEDYLNCPFLNWLEEGKGQVLISWNKLGGDMDKRFSLATFYMINHQMAFYHYTEGGHMSREHPGRLISEWQWNEYVPYDIGQPDVNTLGLEDFQGNSGTDRYFVWEENSYYKILGREYLRDDGVRTLVLTKIMASGGMEGANPTTHELPRCYQPVQSDLTLGTPTREITLRNNEGIILVQDPGCLAPPVAEFSANVTSGCAPMTVSFTDLSTNVPTLWNWDFGAAGGSFFQNPVVTFDDPGYYTVQLTVSNTDGSDIEIKTSYITVLNNTGGGGGKGELPIVP